MALHGTSHTKRHVTVHGTTHQGSNPLMGVTRDATSGIYTPSSAVEWANFLAGTGLSGSLAAPNHLWLLQEASGNPADTIGTGIGTRNLTATTAGNAPAYQKTIAGWARKAIGGQGILANTSLGNTSMVNTATTSFMVLMLSTSAPTITLRNMLTYGSPALQQPGASNKTRARLGVSIVDSVADHVNAVHPYVLNLNATTSTCAAFSDLQKFGLTFSASSGAGLSYMCCGVADVTTADFLYACAWDGSAAEVNDATIKSLLQALGYTISY